MKQKKYKKLNEYSKETEQIKETQRLLKAKPPVKGNPLVKGNPPVLTPQPTVKAKAPVQPKQEEKAELSDNELIAAIFDLNQWLKTVPTEPSQQKGKELKKQIQDLERQKSSI